MAALLSGVSAASPSFVSSAQWLRLHSSPSSRSLMKMLNWTGPSTVTSYSPPAWLCATDHQPLGLAVQLVFNALHCLIIQLILQQLVYEDVMQDSVKGLTDVRVDNIHCSCLVYQASHLTAEVYQAGQAWVPLGEAMLTISDDFLVIHVLGLATSSPSLRKLRLIGL